MNRRILGFLVTVTTLAGCMNAVRRPPDPVPYSKLSAHIPNPKVQAGLIGHAYPILTAVFSTEPNSFNKFYAEGVNSQYALNFLYESLVEANPKTATVEPGLAESWTVSPDQKTFTFQLREGLQWSDGKPLTAADVAFTFNEIIQSPKFPDNRMIDSVKIDEAFATVTALDARHVKFELPRVFGPFLSTIAGGVPVVPAYQWRPLTQNKDSKGRYELYTAFSVSSDVTRLVSGGPYTIASYEPGQRIILNRNPHYALRVDQKRHPLPYADRIMLLITPNFSTESLKMMAGEADMMLETIRAKDYQIMKPLEKTSGFKVVDGGTDFGSFFIALNLNQDRDAQGKPYVDPIKQRWFGNVHFRRAVSCALDRGTLIRNLSLGLAEPSYGPLPSSHPYYTDDIEKYAYDLGRARKELEAGGFRWDTHGKCLDDAGHPVVFDLLVYSESPNSIPLGNVLKADLEKIGIELRVKPVIFNVIVEKSSKTLDFDAFIMGFTGSVEPNTGANLWRSSGTSHLFNQRLPGSSFKAPPRDFEVRTDQIYTEATATLDETKRRTLFEEWQRLIASELPLIHISNRKAIYAYRANLQNTEPTALAATFLYHPFVTYWQMFPE